MEKEISLLIIVLHENSVRTLNIPYKSCTNVPKMPVKACFNMQHVHMCSQTSSCRRLYMMVVSRLYFDWLFLVLLVSKT